jgi:hypothetical protein
MFTHTCSHCSRRQLIFGSQVTAVTAVENGLAYTFTCWCGETETALEVTEITERSQTVRAA